MGRSAREAARRAVKVDPADPERLKAAYVFHPNLSFPALLSRAFRELGIPDDPGETGGMMDRFHLYLMEENRKGRTVALFLDEAQNLPVATLENLLLLSNLETESPRVCWRLHHLRGWGS